MITLKIKRPNGEIENVDVTAKFNFLDKKVFDLVKKATAEAGRGEVIEAVKTYTTSNMSELRRAYNNLMNEGAEGYMPEDAFFMASPEYKEFEKTEIIK